MLSQLLSFIEFTVITQKKMFSPANALLASQIQQEVAQNLNYAFLNDDVWQGEATPTDLADNHDCYLYDE